MLHHQPAPVALHRHAALVVTSLSRGMVATLCDRCGGEDSRISNIPKRQGPSGSCGGSFDCGMDLQPMHASALQTQLTPQMWERAQQGQEATILQPSSEKVGLALSSNTHHVAMTATPSADSDHHQTDTAHGQTDASSCHLQASSLPNHLTHGVSWRYRAGKLFLRRTWRRRPVEALAHRVRHEDDVSIMVSEGRDFGERKIRGEVRRVDVSNRQQTNYYGHQAPVGRGGGDRAVVVQGPGRTRDSGTALWQLRHEEDELQHERKKLLPLGWERFRVEEIKELAMERNISVS